MIINILSNIFFHVRIHPTKLYTFFIVTPPAEVFSSTLKMMNTSTAPNAIIKKGELERSTTGITRVLLDVS